MSSPAAFTKREQLGCASALVVAYLSGNMAPMLLGAVQDGLELTRGQAGLLTTLEFAAYGASALLLAPWLPRLPRRRIAMLATLVAAIAHVISAAGTTYALVAPARILAGAAHGAVIASAFAIIARARDSERIYARGFSAVVVVASVGYFVLPRVTPSFSYHGAYVYVGLMALALFPVLRLLPADDRSGDGGPAAGGGERLGIAVVVALFAAGLVSFSDGLVWTMSERIGVSLGMSPRQIGSILGPSIVAGLIGTILAERIGARRGLAIPLMAGIWATAIAGFVLANASGVGAYATGAVLKNITLFFVLPYLAASAAALDPEGRAAAATGGVIPLGYGTGPYVAGLLVERWGFGLVGWCGLGVVAVATIIYVRVFRTIRAVG